MIPSPSRIAFVLCLFLCTVIQAQSQQYYVIVGAFANETNAKKFSGFVRSRFFQATYEINSNRNLFYVYVNKYNDKKEAVDQVLLLQKEEAFRDSWVFTGSLGNTPAAVIEIKTQPKAKDPEPVISEPQPVVSVPVENAKTETTSVPTVTTATVTASETAKPKRVVKGKLFLFDIRTPAGEALAGNVHHVDLQRGRDLATYSSTDYSDVPKPSQEPMTLVCGIFGYKEITQLVDYQNPSLTEGASQDAEEGAWVIPFKLERLKKGDVSVMYDVSFYKDAVVMLPRSQEELDELVNLMTANAGYVIKIHGHTNGNNKRKIISLGKKRNYFTMEGSDQKNGSAKELSKQRAEAIRDYLVEHGIDKSRMEIMAWGGTNMLMGENSAGAKLNDRIEIEILEDGT